MAKWIIKQFQGAKVIYGIEEVEIYPEYILMGILAYRVVHKTDPKLQDYSKFLELTDILYKFSEKVLNLPINLIVEECENWEEVRGREIEKARKAGLYDGYTIVRMCYEIKGTIYKTTHICKGGVGECHKVYDKCLKEIAENDVVIIDETTTYLEYEQEN